MQKAPGVVVPGAFLMERAVERRWTDSSRRLGGLGGPPHPSIERKRTMT